MTFVPFIIDPQNGEVVLPGLLDTGFAGRAAEPAVADPASET